MKVFFSGDLFAGGDLIDYQPDPIKLPEFLSADLRVLNLESPISEKGTVPNKPILYSPNAGIDVLKKINANIVGLANNHIHDRGNTGISETISRLESNGIKYFGAGHTLEGASKPVELTDGIYILGYCQYDSPTLNFVQKAERNSPGVNPLNYDKVISDIDSLPDSSKVILYFHWGREHVWLTQFKNIELAKKLFEHPKVLHIIGMHPHRVQGVLSRNNKKCYFSLGNFLFPNFYVKPEHELYYPSIQDKVNVKFTTYQYHPVKINTYKKWKLVNRISIALMFDSKDLTLKPIVAYQKGSIPEIIPLSKIMTKGVLLWVKLISQTYRLPKSIYVPLEKVHARVTFKLWNLKIKMSMVRQLGLKGVLKKLTQKPNLQ